MPSPADVEKIADGTVGHARIDEYVVDSAAAATPETDTKYQPEPTAPTGTHE